MQNLRKRELAAAVAVLAVVGAAGGAATAFGVGGSSPARTDPLLRAYPTCPARNRHVIRSTTAGSSTALVPSDASHVLLCRYSGLGSYPDPAGPRSFRLVAQHLINSSPVTSRLASELNALHAATGVVHCPADRGDAIIAFFRYGSTPKADDPVTIGLSGCSTVTNGSLTRTAGTPTGIKLVDELEFLTRPTAYEAMPYRLLTHCGIEWARIRGTFWKAGHRVSDGHGNPPAGWGNPYQAGTLSFSSRDTAVFTSGAGRVTFHRTERTRAPLVCS